MIQLGLGYADIVSSVSLLLSSVAIYLNWKTTIRDDGKLVARLLLDNDRACLVMEMKNIGLKDIVITKVLNNNKVVEFEPFIRDPVQMEQKLAEQRSRYSGITLEGSPALVLEGIKQSFMEDALPRKVSSGETLKLTPKDVSPDKVNMKIIDAHKKTWNVINP